LPQAPADFALNFHPASSRLMLGCPRFLRLLLGGVTWIPRPESSRKCWRIRRLNNRTPSVLSILVLEILRCDLSSLVAVMLLAVRRLRRGLRGVALPLPRSLFTPCVTIPSANGPRMSQMRWFAEHLGAVLLVAGIAQKLRVSSAIGAFW